eukprot:562191-Pleurochrysis_carterae.AAC.1
MAEESEDEGGAEEEPCADEAAAPSAAHTPVSATPSGGGGRGHGRGRGRGRGRGAAARGRGKTAGNEANANTCDSGEDSELDSEQESGSTEAGWQRNGQMYVCERSRQGFLHHTPPIFNVPNPSKMTFFELC